MRDWEATLSNLMTIPAFRIAHEIHLQHYLANKLIGSVLDEHKDDFSTLVLGLGLAKALDDYEHLDPPVIIALLREMMPAISALAQAQESLIQCGGRLKWLPAEMLVIMDRRQATWRSGDRAVVFDLESVEVLKTDEMPKVWMTTMAYNLPGVYAGYRRQIPAIIREEMLRKAEDAKSVATNRSRVP